MSNSAAIIINQSAKCVHLVRVNDNEYYFREIKDALAKLKDEPDASYQRITLH